MILPRNAGKTVGAKRPLAQKQLGPCVSSRIGRGAFVTVHCSTYG